MCGRTACARDPANILAETRVTRWNDQSRYRTSYNVPPTRYQPVLLNEPSTEAETEAAASAAGPSSGKQSTRGGSSSRPVKKGHSVTESSPKHASQSSIDVSNDERVLRSMKWGLYPSWMKEAPGTGSNPYSTVNARDDSLFGNKPMFNKIKHRRRGVVVADGYFEWKRETGKDSQPYFFQPKDGSLLKLGVLYDIWYPHESDKKVTKKKTKKASTKTKVKKASPEKNGSGPSSSDPEADDPSKPLYTYIIITTKANEQASQVHNRMPLILESEADIDTWLRRDLQFEDVQNLVHPYRGQLEMYPVTRNMGRVAFKDATAVEKLEAIENESGNETTKSPVKTKTRRPSKPSTVSSSRREKRKRTSTENANTNTPDSSTNVTEQASKKRSLGRSQSPEAPLSSKEASKITDFFSSKKK